MDYTITIRVVEETTMAKSGRLETGLKLITAAIYIGLIWEVLRPLWKFK